MKFRPLHDRIVVKRVTADEKTAGGIIIPDTAKEKPQRGTVVAAGPGRGPVHGPRPGGRAVLVAPVELPRIYASRPAR